jgi:teichoic acid transport system permease protein
VDNSGQISAPGSLQAGAVIAPDTPRVPDQDLGELARQHGLKLSGARPSLSRYLLTLWQRRHFIVGYATARNVSMYTDAKLGQIWQVLTPLLNAGVYYLIFGLLFEAARGVAHYPAFLVTGVFVFAFSERSIVTGSNVMRANLQLIRALYFPRASLPLAYVIVELQQMLVGMVVVTVVMLISQQYPSWYWLLLIPVILLQSMFNTGAALIVARLGGAMADVSELIPFFLRISRYFCGVMYLIITLPAVLTNWEKQVLSLNPFAVYISLTRVAFMSSYRTNSAGNQPFNKGLCQQFISHPGAPITPFTRVPTTLIAPDSKLSSIVIPPGSKISNIPLQAYCHAIVTNNDLWIAAIGWGVVFFAIGIVFFWRAEHLYGRG